MRKFVFSNRLTLSSSLNSIQISTIKKRIFKFGLSKQAFLVHKVFVTF